MPSSVQEELDLVLKKFVRMQNDDILEDLEKIMENREITKEERILAKIIQSYIHIDLYNQFDKRGSLEISNSLIHEAIKESENLEDNYLIYVSKMSLAGSYFIENKWQEFRKSMQDILPSFEEFKPRSDLFYLLLKSSFLMYKALLLYSKVYAGEELSDAEREEAYQYWVEGEKLSEKNKIYAMQLVFLNNIYAFHTWRGELDLALEAAQKRVDIAKGLDNEELVAGTLSSLAYIFYSKGDYKKYYEISKERLLIYEKTDNEVGIIGVYHIFGFYYTLIGEYDEALEYYERCYEHGKKYGRENPIAFLQQNIGYVYFLKGDFDKALEFYDQAFPVLQENQPQGWHLIFSNLAEINIQKGDLEEALKNLDQMMPILKGLQHHEKISDVLSDKGVIYWQKGMKEQALSSMQEGLEIRRQIDNNNLIATSLSYLIQFNVELNEIEVAKQYFETLELICEEEKSKQISQYCNFSEALILKTSSDLRDRLKAEVLLEQVIKEDISYSLLIQVLLNLCDLLILEIKETDDSKILKKIYKHVNRLQELAEKNKSPLLLVETIRLNAQLALLEFDIDNARALLLKALNIAQEKHLDRLVLDILQQQEKLTKQSIELRSLEKTSSTISERMTVVEIEDTVSVIKRTSITETIKKDEEVSKKLFSIQI